MVGPPTLAISSRNELLAAVLERLELWFRRLDARPGELYEANHMSDKGTARKNTSNVRDIKREDLSVGGNDRRKGKARGLVEQSDAVKPG
jgi:hypothetical protein